MAMNAIGHSQYMAANQASEPWYFAWAGDDTDPPAAATAAASSNEADGLRTVWFMEKVVNQNLRGQMTTC